MDNSNINNNNPIMLNSLVSKKQKITLKKASLLTEILTPSQSPLYTFELFGLICEFCDDDTLCALICTCQYFRTAISIQPQFEVRVYKNRFAKLSEKYFALKSETIRNLSLYDTEPLDLMGNYPAILMPKPHLNVFFFIYIKIGIMEKKYQA